MTTLNEIEVTKRVVEYFDALISERYFGQFPTPCVYKAMEKDVKKTFPYFTDINISYDFDGFFLLRFKYEDESYAIKLRPPPFSIP